MSNDLAQRLAYNRNLQCYLSQLSHLANQNVTADDLFPLEVTRAIQEQSICLLDKTAFRKFKIKFSEKLDARFSTFVKNLYALNSSPIYIWVEYTNTCGLFEISSIMEFNAKFEYSVVSGGIISLLTKDMLDNIVLDFFEDSSGERFIEIELVGRSWVTCVY